MQKTTMNFACEKVLLFSKYATAINTKIKIPMAWPGLKPPAFDNQNELMQANAFKMLYVFPNEDCGKINLSFNKLTAATAIAATDITVWTIYNGFRIANQRKKFEKLISVELLHGEKTLWIDLKFGFEAVSNFNKYKTNVVKYINFVSLLIINKLIHNNSV